MKVGIPKAMQYFLTPVLYDEFFKKLGIEVIHSSDTNKITIEEGKKYAIDEDCLASKIYIGHVAELIEKIKANEIDYIFIPRIGYFNKRETVCVKFYAMYDICRNIFGDYKDSFIDLNIDYLDGKSELKAFIKLGETLNLKYVDIISSYLYARKKQDEYNYYMYMKQITLLESTKNDNALKNFNPKLNVLIVAHPYISYDKYLGQRIIDYLVRYSSSVNICFADKNKYNLSRDYINIVNNKEANCDKSVYKTISSTLYWKYSQNLVNGLIEFIPKVDGVIYLSAFPCGPDALVNDLVMRKVKDKPSINIVIDEQEMGAGLYTRLESFIDILEQNKLNEISLREIDIKENSFKVEVV